MINFETMGNKSFDRFSHFLETWKNQDYEFFKKYRENCAKCNFKIFITSGNFDTIRKPWIYEETFAKIEFSTFLKILETWISQEIRIPEISSKIFNEGTFNFLKILTFFEDIRKFWISENSLNILHNFNFNFLNILEIRESQEIWIWEFCIFFNDGIFKFPWDPGSS